MGCTKGNPIVILPQKNTEAMEDGYTLKEFNSSKKRRTCHDLASKKYPSDCSANHKRITIGRKHRSLKLKEAKFFISRNLWSTS